MAILALPADQGDAAYGTSQSRLLRSAIRQGFIQAPSSAFDQAVADIYSQEREQESNGQTDIRGTGSAVS